MLCFILTKKKAIEMAEQKPHLLNMPAYLTHTHSWGKNSVFHAPDSSPSKEQWIKVMVHLLTNCEVLAIKVQFVWDRYTHNGPTHCADTNRNPSGSTVLVSLLIRVPLQTEWLYSICKTKPPVWQLPLSESEFLIIWDNWWITTYSDLPIKCKLWISKLCIFPLQ